MPVHLVASTGTAVYVREADETEAAPQRAIPLNNCQIPAPTRAEGSHVQIDVSQHLDHQPKQCPAPRRLGRTLFMAATVLLAVIVCLVCCIATAIGASPLANAKSCGSSTPAPSQKAVRRGSTVAQKWVTLQPKWHAWWGCFGASMKASWRVAGTAASYCAAKGTAAVTALGHYLCAAASSVPTITAAGIARFQRVCCAAKLWYTAVIFSCSSCWVTIATATVWLHLHVQEICSSCARNITAASRAAWRWISVSAAATSKVARISMAASRSSWSCVKLCWSSLGDYFKASEQRRRQSWSLARELCCFLASSTQRAAKACCAFLSAAAQPHLWQQRPVWRHSARAGLQPSCSGVLLSAAVLRAGGGVVLCQHGCGAQPASLPQRWWQLPKGVWQLQRPPPPLLQPVL